MTLTEVLVQLGMSKSLAKKKAPELRRLLGAAGWRAGFPEIAYQQPWGGGGMAFGPIPTRDVGSRVDPESSHE